MGSRSHPDRQRKVPLWLNEVNGMAPDKAGNIGA